MSIIINNKKDILNDGVNNSLYELVLLFRSNIISNDVHNDLSSLVSFISMRLSGSVISHEYWGLRPLSYEISGNKKAHFYFFSLSLKPSSVTSIKQFLANNANIIRSLILKSTFSESELLQPTQMMKNLASDIDKEMGEIHVSEDFNKFKI
ncbi:30S ribosomal protein S6 [Candidatus Deianiraea vastatrix]|uniref:Small ribosomal subunit protein bS6 n=1 Tax=Candidatus Deianiraea vastatrix TaxID=2163644 RepID=A0A5B8XDI3_9RICK|nr:30S ribosomal protein S6 [Candidatus Deianiraea vastatrix]QED23419.1 30S ribosomal protein S6 [Candidatus Deianiraea vastatrix]